MQASNSDGRQSQRQHTHGPSYAATKHSRATLRAPASCFWRRSIFFTFFLRLFLNCKTAHHKLFMRPTRDIHTLHFDCTTTIHGQSELKHLHNTHSNDPKGAQSTRGLEGHHCCMQRAPPPALIHPVLPNPCPPGNTAVAAPPTTRGRRTAVTSH